MSWTFCTSGSAVSRAGVHCNAISGSAVVMTKWSDEAEGMIEQETHTDWTTTYSSLPTGIKNQLSNVCSSIIAMRLIAYDPPRYLAREADILLNVNDDIINKGLKALENKTYHTLTTP